MKFIRAFAAEETGQTLSEYALLVTFILLGSIAVAAGYNKSVSGVTSTVNANLVAASSFMR